MADEPLALSTTPPAVPADDDDPMCAALRQTEDGRRFLEEHVRRQRASDLDSLTEAIEPVDAVEEYAEPQTDILAAVERLQDLAWIMREHGLETATCEHIEALTSTILTTPSLCDPGDPRAQKLAQALGHLERRIDSMIVAARGRAKERLPERTGLPFAVPAPQEEVPVSPFETEVGERPAETANDRSAVEPPEETARDSLPPMEKPEKPPCPLTPSPSPPPVPHGVLESAPPDFLSEPMPPASRASAPPQPEPIVAASSPAEEPSPDLDDELFASSRIPAFQAAPRAPPAVVSATPAVVSATPAAVPPTIGATRSDPLAALNAMSEEEKIALFT